MSIDVQELIEDATGGWGEEMSSRIQSHELPPVVRELIEEYNSFSISRDPFLWRFIYVLAPHYTFSFVPDDRVEDVYTSKTLSTLFITLIDDVLERERDRETFDELAKIPFSAVEADPSAPGVDAELVKFTQRIWTELHDRLVETPGYEDHRELFRFDLKQAINAIDYSYVATINPEAANFRELVAYDSHNVMMFPYANIDMMYANLQCGHDLATLRRAIWHAQLMARIGNWIATWERELEEGDFSSGHVVYALEEGAIDPEHLEAVSTGAPDAVAEVVQRIKDANIDEVFFDQWADNYGSLVEINDELNELDISPYIRGMETVFKCFVMSKGDV